MSRIQQVYKKKSLLSESIKNSIKIESNPIPIPQKNIQTSPCSKDINIINRVGINEVNEIDGIKKNNKSEQNIENLRNLLSSSNTLPPNFSPSTPPEHSIIYQHMYYNDKNYINKYDKYNLSENLVQSL